jgi:uncharacterized protein (TIGR04255 family)
MSEIYPNSPLFEVIFEVMFSIEPVVECRRDVFLDLIRKDYPNVLVPEITAGSPMALKPYRFESTDNSSGVMLSINKFSYYTRKYQGFELFKKEVEQLSSKFTKAYPMINKLLRIGCRHVNIIPFIRTTDGCVPLDDFLKVEIKVPNSIPKKYSNLNIGIIAEGSGYSITTRIETIPNYAQDKEVILLDFDYSKIHELLIKDVVEYLEQGHKKTKQIFEEIITDRYRNYLKDEAI